MPKVTHGEEALSTLMIETPDDSFASSMSPCSIYCQGMDLAFSVNGRLHMCLCLFWRAHCVIQETDVCVFSCFKVGKGVHIDGCMFLSVCRGYMMFY